jgi:class 3 adenylate cyclase
MTVRALLFTDVVDSTRLVERLGDARAAEVWASHDRRARDLVAQHHGREIGRADGVFLLFKQVVPRQSLRHLFRLFLPQPTAAFDVREQEGDDATRQQGIGAWCAGHETRQAGAGQRYR